MMKNFWTMSLAFWVLLGAGALRADERMIMENEDLSIIFEEPYRERAEALQRIYPQTKEDIERTLGWHLLSKPLVILVGSAEAFEQMSGSPYISAYALPERHIIVMGRSIMASEPYLFNVTFKHELCHLFLHDHIEESLLPKWLDEGVCQWVSGSLGELVLSPMASAAGRMDLSRHAVPLYRLAHTFPSDKYQLLLAYEESRSFVEYLSANHGPASLPKILNSLKDGNDIHRAVRMILSKPLDSLEEEWLATIRTRSVWIIWIGQYLYEVLFILAALLTVAAFIRLQVKKRRYAEEEEEEDQAGDHQ